MYRSCTKGIGVEADGRQLEFAPQGPLIERLDVNQLVGKNDIARYESSLSPGRKT
jgi:hypothetical protein